MRKQNQQYNDERTHFFRKNIPLKLYSNGWESVTNGLCVRGKLETEQTATVPPSLAALLSHSAGLLNQGS